MAGKNNKNKKNKNVKTDITTPNGVHITTSPNTGNTNNSGGRGGNNKKKRKPRNNRNQRMVNHVANDPLSRLNMEAFRRAMDAAEHTPSSEAGRAYVKIKLNPCHDSKVIGYGGTPTGEDTMTAKLFLRDDLVIAPFQPIDGPLDDRLWTLLNFSTPYLAAQLIMILCLSDAVPTQNEVRQTLNALTAAQWDGPAKYPNRLRPTQQVIGGVISPYTGTDMEITQMTPAGLSNFGAAAANTGWAEIRKWRYVSKGHTVHLNAPGLANQGRTIVAHTATESSLKNGRLVNTLPSEVDPILRASVSPPFTDATLAMADPQAFQDITKAGDYVIHRMWNVDPIWNEVEDVRPIWRVPPNTLVGTNQEYLIPTNAHLKLDGFDLNMSWIVSNIRGLSSQASIHIKHRSYLEFNAPGSSVYAPFLSDPPAEDMGAINLVHKLQSELPHTYIAAYNDWGMLAGLLKQCVARIASPLIRNTLSFGTKFLHNAVDQGSRFVHNKLRQYDTYDGEATYG